MMRKAVFGFFVILNLILFYNLLWSAKGLFNFLELRTHHAKLEAIQETVDARCLELSQEIRWLTSDRAFAEKMVRSRLNYLKSNEILYVFPNQASAAAKVGDDLEN